MQCEVIKPRWSGPVVVAASGPSMTEEVARQITVPCVAVSDAYKLIPGADILYSCDSQWWNFNGGARDFAGERWSSHTNEKHNNKTACANKFGLRVIRGERGEIFSTDPSFIRYGRNSGFQSVNLAILMGGNPIILVGFDMRRVGGKSHFFGEHKRPLNMRSSFRAFILAFNNAAEHLPLGLRILNATQGSALKCFPFVGLNDALRP